MTGPESLPEPLRTLLLQAEGGAGVKALQRAAGVPVTGILTRNEIVKLAGMDQTELCAAFLAERAIRMTGMRGFDQHGRDWFKNLFRSALDSAALK